MSSPITLMPTERCHRVVIGRRIQRPVGNSTAEPEAIDGMLVLTSKRLVFVTSHQESGSSLVNIKSIGARSDGKGFTIRVDNSLTPTDFTASVEKFEDADEADAHCRSYETLFPWEFVATIVCAFYQAGLKTQVDVRLAPFFQAA